MLRKDVTNPRDAKKELKKYGFSLIRKSGDHYIYSDGKRTITLVNNKKRFSKHTWSDSIRRAYAT